MAPDPAPTVFEGVADAYDVGRPAYPSAVYDALGGLEGAMVLEGGAGTGIATRQLMERGCTVVPFDVGAGMLSRARARTSGLMAVVADGAALPFRDACADLVCFAQSWHWLDETARCPEASRVLRPGGRWAGWWSHARADGEEWFDAYWSLMEAACPGTNRDARDIDWGAGVNASGFFTVDPRVTVPWTRELSIGAWLTDQSSHSYIAGLPAPERDRLLAGLRGVLEAEFPDGTVTVPYETWLWIGHKV